MNILSLTSHPPRFTTLVVFFDLLQGMELFDKVILWIAQQDSVEFKEIAKTIPLNVEVKYCQDLGPGKKLIPALIQYPNDKIVTIDDDLIYERSTFLEILRLAEFHPLEIIAGRTHFVTYDSFGKINPYGLWKFEYCDSDEGSEFLFPTTGGITLFPPKSFHSDVTNSGLYLDVAKFQDDLWFWVQARRKGTLVRRVPGHRPISSIDGTQRDGLWETMNSKGGNDLALLRLLGEYGDELRIL
jgi:hypothetical protein